MEARIVDILRQHSLKRNQLINWFVAKLPPGLLENGYTVHSSLIGFSLAVIIAVFATTRSLTLFSLHPVCMTIGSILCFGEGLITYRNTFLLDSLSPIMQHDKSTKVRTIHQTIMILGGTFITFGLIFIIVHKLEVQRTIRPHSIHGFLGILALLVIVLQILSGSWKMSQLMTTRRRVLNWHGDIGLILWDLLILTLFVGLASTLQFSISSLFVCLSSFIVWVVIVFQLHSRSGLRDEDAVDGIETADLLYNDSSKRLMFKEGVQEDGESSDDDDDV